MIGLLRVQNKKFDHGNKIWFPLFDETFLCIFVKADKRFVIYRYFGSFSRFSQHFGGNKPMKNAV